MFRHLPPHVRSIPFDILKSPSVYSRDKCELWAITFLMEYLRNLSSQEFVSRYGARGLDELVPVARRFLDPNALNYSPKEVKEITQLRMTKIRQLSGHFSGAEVQAQMMRHVYSCKGYLYKFFTQFLKYFLPAAVVPVSFDLVYCTAGTQQSYYEILKILEYNTPSHNIVRSEKFATNL